MVCPACDALLLCRCMLNCDIRLRARTCTCSHNRVRPCAYFHVRCKYASEEVTDVGFCSFVAEFAKLEERCFVSGKHSILLVLQGLDTGGKDGAIKVLLG